MPNADEITDVNGKNQDRLGIQSVETAAQILEALADAPVAIPLKDLASAAGMHPGKVHRYLVSLSRTGLVSQDPATGHYGIGPMALKIGLAALRNVDPVRHASEELPSLRDEINETVVLSVWGNLGPTVVWMEESGQAVRVNLRIGNVLPIMGTAIGRVFAAYLTPDALKTVSSLQRGRIESIGDLGTVKGPEMASILAQVRTDGIARIDGTLIPGIAAIAVPIRNHQGTVVAVVASIGRREEFDLRLDGTTARAVKKVAARVSERLGYTP